MRSALPVATGLRLVVLMVVLATHGLPAPVTAQERDVRIGDLRDRVVKVRSIDPADEDFSDLAGLAAAIGNARIVQLGESTHGDGAAFAAKARLVKFLHRELGFDVLAWESGMYDLRVVNDSLGAGADPAASARLGVFGIWSATRDVLPLFEYARNSHAGDRPLEMAGVDLQFSGRRVHDLEADLLRFVAGAEAEAVRDTAARLVRDVAEAFHRIDAMEGAAPTPPDLERFLGAADALLAYMQSQRAALASIRGEREAGFMERVAGNLRDYGISRYERNFAGRPAQGPASRELENKGWNRRDTRMASNLRWLAEAYYPDRKLIVWAHNGHIMNAHYHADWSALAHEPADGGMKPMGAFIAEQLGDAVYTIGFTANAGEYGMVGMPILQQIEAMPRESLEGHMLELGYDQAFLDFRALPREHWLRRPATMSIRGHMPEVMENWTRVVDGIFFIARMAGATPLMR